MNHFYQLTALAIATAAALTLGGCNQRDDTSVGQKVDSAIATTERRAAEVKAEVKQDVAEAKASAQAGADRAASAVSNSADKAGKAIGNAATGVAESLADAAITASVNAELVKDPTLSALRINVETSFGRVVLTGSAPSNLARDRATGLAQAIKGVTGVDNRLDVRS